MGKSRSDLLSQFSVQYSYKNTYTNDQQESVNDFYPTTYFRTQLQESFSQNSRDQKEHGLRMNGSFTQRKRHSIEFGLSARLRDDEGANNRFTNKGISNKTDFSVEWDITYRFFVNSRYIYTHRHSTMLERDINEQVLNATVGVKLFSNHRGKLTFNAFDILNDQSNILNSANDIYVQTTYKPLNTSYFTVSFEYRLSNQ